MQDNGLASGTTFEGRYEIVAKLGEGGFGEVHEARQSTTGQRVALKIMRRPEHGDAARTETRIARFLREAQLSLQLHHPNIVQVVDSGQTGDGRLYTVFTFAPGDNLADLLAKEGALAPREAQHLMLQVLDALACAHDAGVVHRDLKPSNVIVTPTGARRNAMVLDFGIGAIIDGAPDEGASRLTGSNDALGTPGYGAPEQWRGVEPSPRADLFAWGLVFLECLTGKPVYSGGTAAEILYHLLGPDPVPIPAGIEHHPLGDVLRRATQKDVATRAATARELLEALESCDLRGLSREAIAGADGSFAGHGPWLLSIDSSAAAAPQEPAAPPSITGDRRQLTALCCHLRARATSANVVGIEDQDEILRGALATCAGVARGHRGRLAAALGDDLLVYFGFPRAAEDDARRAARAALAIGRAVESENERLAAREVRIEVGIGIHTGLVIAGDLPGLGGASLVVGSTPRIAAALASSAPQGSAAASADAHALLRAAFELEAEGEVFRLVRERDVKTPGVTPDGAKVPLIGRQQELELLLDRWRRVRGGAGQSSLVTGEPGIGKSRLARELRDRLAGDAYAFIEGRCSPDTQNNALFPIVDLLGRALGLDQEADPAGKIARLAAQLVEHGLEPAEMMPLFLPLFSLPFGEAHAPLDVSPQRQKALTLNAMASLLLAMAEKQPVLLLVEDLHWADPTTLELLAQLVREVPSAPMCLLLTARPEFSPSFSTTGMLQLPLGRLERSQIETMLTELTAHKPLPQSVVDQVVSRTDGVPLFVEELTRMMVESGVLVEREDGYALQGSLSDVEIPGTLRALLTVRLDRLDRAKETAQIAAALGREFSVEVLSAVSPNGPDAVREDLDRLMSAGLVLRKRRMRDPVGVFKHALVRDTAYESLSRAARLNVHARIARTLEERFTDVVTTRPDVLAHHLSKADIHDEASFYFTRAGERAKGVFANAEAIGHYEAALSALSMTPPAARDARTHADIAERLGDLHELTGNHDSARRSYDDALLAAPPAERSARARILRKRAKTWETGHRHAEALADYDAAMAAIGEEPGPDAPASLWDEWLSVQVERVWVHYWLAQVDAMGALVERVRPIVEARGGPALRSRLYQAIVHQDLRRGRYRISPATVDLARAASAAAELIHDLPSRANARFLLGCVLTFSGAPGEGAEALEEVRAAAQRTGDVTLELRALSYLTTARRLSGAVSSTRDLAEGSLRLARRLGMHDYIGVARGNLGWALLREGAREAARGELGAALEAWASIAGKYPYPMQWIARLPLVALCAEENADIEARAHLDAMLGPVQHVLPERLMEALRAAAEAPALDARALAPLIEIARDERYL